MEMRENVMDGNKFQLHKREKRLDQKQRAGTSILIPTPLLTCFLPLNIMCFQKFQVYNKQDVSKMISKFIPRTLRFSPEYEGFSTCRDGGDQEDRQTTMNKNKVVVEYVHSFKNQIQRSFLLMQKIRIRTKLKVELQLEQK